MQAVAQAVVTGAELWVVAVTKVVAAGVAALVGMMVVV